MKKIYFSLCAICVCAMTQAQSAIPNGNFESWTSYNFNAPQYYQTGSIEGIFKCGLSNNVTQTTDFYHGNYAVQMTTLAGNSDTCPGYIVLATNPDNSPCQWPGGAACNQIPTGVRGYYKSNILAGDTGFIIVAFKNGPLPNPNCMGMGLLPITGVHSTYTPFFLPLSLSGTPDTLVFAAISSNGLSKVGIKVGSMLQIDSISFTGITQPATFNGDFENWVPGSVNLPNNWYVQNSGGPGSTTSILQTTDKAAGVYAVEMKTFQDKNNSGAPVARGASISTGYYPHCNGGPCQERGGYAFNHQIDTLCFYYKYAPMGNDTAWANLSFRHLGSNVWNYGMNIHTPASTYQYIEMPYNTMGQAVDTVVVSFQSSSYHDTALTFIGSDFKVDEAHFKSQPLNTGIKTYDPSAGMKVFPNPSANGDFVVSNIDHYDLVRVLNVYGQEVNARVVKENGVAKIHIANAGAYTVYINSRGKITSLKVVVTD